MKIVEKLFEYMVIILNVFISLFFIGSSYAEYVSPSTSLLPAYMGLLFPVFLVINLLFLFYAIIVWNWKLLIVPIFTFFICWGAVKRYFPFNFTKSESEITAQQDVVKVLTYNVMGFGYRDHSDLIPNPTIKYIADSDADIVCLQEFWLHTSPRELTAKKINKALSMYPYHILVILNKGKNSFRGLAVYSKYPISNVRKIKYKSDFNGSVYCELNIRGKQVSLINNHLESFRLSSRDKDKYASMMKDISTNSLEGMKTVFQQRLGPAFKIRANQADVLHDEISKIKTKYVLVCGDFNDTPNSYTHRRIQGETLKDAFVDTGKGLGVTFYRNLFYFRIDNILYGKGIQALKCKVDKVNYSDHYPMWCYFKLD